MRKLMILVHAAAGLLATALHAGLAGSTFEISGGDCRFPDVAHGSVSEKYLVVWADYTVTRVYGRLVTADGAVDGDPFPISESPYGALFPAVAYNATRDEFLVTWDDFNGRGDVIHGQRVRASDGALVGKNFAIGSRSGGIRSAVAWSAARDVYLVVYFADRTPEIYGQRVSGAGALLGANFNISQDGIFSGYPAVAWAEHGDQFLVTWDNDDGNIHGRRVDAAGGTLLGAAMPVTSGGAKDRSAIAYDHANRRWLVQYNDNANPGFSYDQYGRFVGADGTLLGSPLALAHSTGFEGDTQFGGDVTFAPLSARFFSSFGTDSGMAGRESFASGQPAGSPVVLGTGYFTSLNNAADTRRDRFITVWEGLAGAYQIFGRLYAATVGAPGALDAAPGNGQVVLTWQNPDDSHFTGTAIRFATSRWPEGPEDGMAAADVPGTPGASGMFVHAELTNGMTRYYALFAHDGNGNFSAAARVAATPRPRPVAVIDASDFTDGAGGWTLATWGTRPSSPGVIVWDASTESVLATGNGITNNGDTCTREGAILTRAISTAGHGEVALEYDVCAALHAPPGASAAGNCAVLEGSSEDKLVVSISAAGESGPWTVVDAMREGVDLPTPWVRRFVNLAGVPGAGDNPAFAVRFQWQFNYESDAGRLDDIRILGGAGMDPEDAIALAPERIERTVEVGGRLAADSFRVWNAGAGALELAVSESLPWLSVSPPAVTSDGPPRAVAIAYNTSSLPAGTHEGTVRVASPDASRTARTLTIVLHVVPEACVREPFSYYDGALAVMGGASWKGNAADRIGAGDGTLAIVGGGGAESVARTVVCAGAADPMAVAIKVRKGSGSNNFFWSITIDDDAAAPKNLARWYGGSGVARGRIGAQVTPDIVLSGPGAWDELRVEIDPAAGLSEFFFNGASRGTISQESGHGDRIGSIRIERFDRPGVEGDTIFFDDLIIARLALGFFRRGDANGSAGIDIADAVFILSHLFARGPAPACKDSADANDDGKLDIADAIKILGHLFSHTGPLPPPFGACGPDRTPDELDCAEYAPCR